MSEVHKKILGGDPIEAKRFRAYLATLPEGREWLRNARRTSPEPLEKIQPVTITSAVQPAEPIEDSETIPNIGGGYHPEPNQV